MRCRECVGKADDAISAYGHLTYNPKTGGTELHPHNCGCIDCAWRPGRDYSAEADQQFLAIVAGLQA